MRKNFYKVLITLVVAVLVMATVVLTACNGAGKFEYPEAPAKGEVSSNGGLAVKYGDYLYYVNGNQTDATSANKYTGTPKAGDIVRIKLSDLEKVLAMNDDESIDSADLTTEIQKAVYKYAQVVVPMFYYSGNTSEKSVNGLYIFNDKLYFTSPNNQVSAGGNIKNDQLSVYSCDLDGKNLVNLFAIDTLTSLNALYEVDGKVYLVYASESLNVVELTADKREKKEISKTATSPKFDGVNSVVYVNKDGSICKFTAGSDKEVVLVENKDKDKITYSISQYNNGYVYYTMSDTTASSSDFGIWAVKEAGKAKKILNASKDTAGTAYTYLGYNEGIIMTGTIASTEVSAYQLYITSGNGSVKDYILPLNSNDKSITLDKLVGDILYYTLDGKQYSVDLSVGTGKYAPVELTATITANGWAEVDSVKVGDKTLFFAFDSETGVLCYEYKEVDEEMKSVSTTITVSKPAEEDENTDK